uniref:Arrestin-C n=1 Tax=Maurolicus mucronatus TaxID=2034140 RepID=A0A2H4T6S4_9TELE|nr:arrestin 3b [Maurolicus mucronatus]
MPNIFKKNNKNRNMVLFLGRRDFTDHVDHVDIVDGVVKVDPTNLKGRKVWVSLSCAFRYGSEDLDVMGIGFRKNLWMDWTQVYPAPASQKQGNTALQDALIGKCGGQGYPFTFHIPANLPCSVSMQPGPKDKGKCCGVDFEVRAYIANAADNPEEHISKKDSCRLIIRKVQYSPPNDVAGSRAETSKQFLMSDKPVTLEASLAKEYNYHGEPISIKVKVNNESGKAVNTIQLWIEQLTDVVLYSSDKYTRTILFEEFNETINPNEAYEKEFAVTPSLSQNKDKHGIAVDGKLKYEDTNLASSTLMMTEQTREMRGILVSYKIRVVLTMGSGVLGASEVQVEIPMTLMCPKPREFSLEEMILDVA